MTPLTILPTASAHPADCSESDSGIGGSQTLHKTKEAAHRQPPGSATSDKGCEERTSLVRSGLTNIDGRGIEPIKSRRKSTGGILTCISALHCFFPANPDPSFGPPYTERFLPLDQHPHFQVQIKLAPLGMQVKSRRMLIQGGTGPALRKSPQDSPRYLPPSQPMAYPAKHLCRSAPMELTKSVKRCWAWITTLAPAHGRNTICRHGMMN